MWVNASFILLVFRSNLILKRSERTIVRAQKA